MPKLICVPSCGAYLSRQNLARAPSRFRSYSAGSSYLGCSWGSRLAWVMLRVCPHHKPRARNLLCGCLCHPHPYSHLLDQHARRRPPRVRFHLPNWNWCLRRHPPPSHHLHPCHPPHRFLYMSFHRHLCFRLCSPLCHPLRATRVRMNLECLSRSWSRRDSLVPRGTLASLRAATRWLVGAKHAPAVVVATLQAMAMRMTSAARLRHHRHHLRRFRPPLPTS